MKKRFLNVFTVVAIAVATKTDLPANYTCQNTFADVSSVIPNSWACRAVEVAAQNDIITTANATFRPEEEITRSESLAMLLKGA